MRYFIALLLITSTCHASIDPPISPWIRANGDLSTSDSWSRGEAELFLPMCQANGALLFTSLRGSKYGVSHLSDGSAALGYRQVVGCNWIVGGNIFYDALLNKCDRWSHYMGVGIEALTPCLDFHLNCRQPLTTRQRSLGQTPNPLATILVDDEVRLLTQLTGQIVSRWSVDAEAGYRLCLPCCFHHARIYVGGQYSPEKCDSRRAYLGMELYNKELCALSHGLQLTVGARVSSDALGYISIRKRLGTNRRCCTPLIARMDDPIIRRQRPCGCCKAGPIINEPLTTAEYPVDGIWVAYSAVGADLQTQIDLARPTGMIFTDGPFDTTALFLDQSKVIAGGNAFLTPFGAVTGATVNWGNWGLHTTNPGIVNNTDQAGTALTMGQATVVDTLTINNGFLGIANTPNATNLTIRDVEINNINGIGSIGLSLNGSNDTLVERVAVNGGPTSGFAYNLVDSDRLVLRQLTTSNNLQGSIFNTTPDLLLDGWTSADDGGNSLTLIFPTDNTITNLQIDNAGFDSISILLGSGTTISNAVLNNSGSDAIFMGGNDGFNTITDVTIFNYGSDGIQLGGSASSPFVNPTLHAAIDRVTITNTNPAITGAAIQSQTDLANATSTHSINNSTFNLTGSNVGLQLTLQDPTATLNLSGTNNTINPATLATPCAIFGTGTINGHVTYNGTQTCP